MSLAVYGFIPKSCKYKIITACIYRYHVAFTISPSLAAIYVNGIQACSSSSAGFNFSSVYGTVTDAWIGRSHNSADVYLNAYLKDYRVYSDALP